MIDDEWNVRNLLRIHLSQNGFEVIEAENGLEGVKLAVELPCDLIILDVMLPDMDGWTVCKKIRETKNTPILMLTARTDTKDKVKGLTIGADDYLVKPFDSDEFIARVFALVRRSSILEVGNAQNTITFKDLTIDIDGRQIMVCEKPVEFSPKEFDLLLVLAEQPRRAFERETLLDKVWGTDFFGDFRTVDSHVKNIREKVRRAGLAYNPIQTVWGVGYKFQLADKRK
ncbi:response regulator transcription factor [Bacillus sp. B1-b2]|nr:response regulator transcription factor [Bacillus sp. B1-b2]